MHPKYVCHAIECVHETYIKWEEDDDDALDVPGAAL